MPVIRVAQRTNPYAQIPNASLRDPSLSLAATGLLTLMLSYADGWEFNYAHLITMKTNGRDAFKSAMRELVAAGYVKKTPKQGAGGKLEGWEWEVREEPTDSLENRLTGKPSDGLPTTKNTNDKKTKKTQPSSASPTPSADKLFAEQSGGLHAVTERAVQSLVDTWNEHCGSLPSVRSVPPKRKSALIRLVTIAGGVEQARSLLLKATKEVAQDDFWVRSKKYGLDNLLAGDKVFQRAEAYDARVEPAAVRVQVAVGQRVKYKSPLRGVSVGVVVATHDSQVEIEDEVTGQKTRLPYSAVVS